MKKKITKKERDFFAEMQSALKEKDLNKIVELLIATREKRNAD